jgi:hypothetical protein
MKHDGTDRELGAALGKEILGLCFTRLPGDWDGRKANLARCAVGSALNTILGMAIEAFCNRGEERAAVDMVIQILESLLKGAQMDFKRCGFEVEIDTSLSRSKGGGNKGGH